MSRGLCSAGCLLHILSLYYFPAGVLCSLSSLTVSHASPNHQDSRAFSARCCWPTCSSPHNHSGLKYHIARQPSNLTRTSQYAVVKPHVWLLCWISFMCKWLTYFSLFLWIWVCVFTDYLTHFLHGARWKHAKPALLSTVPAWHLVWLEFCIGWNNIWLTKNIYIIFKHF